MNKNTTIIFARIANDDIYMAALAKIKEQKACHDRARSFLLTELKRREWRIPKADLERSSRLLSEVAHKQIDITAALGMLAA